MKARYIILYNSVLMIFGFLLLKVVFAAAGPNVTESSFKENYNVATFFPEGWGFFTRSPRGDKYALYKVEQSNKLTPVHFKNADAKSLYGFSRKSRRINMEISRVAALVKKDSSWVRVEDKDEVISRTQFTEVEITRAKADPERLRFITPGTYILKKYKIAPWSWAKYPDNFKKSAYVTSIILQ
ncbi:SdpA family antimicrobial peptide system protein [Hymenobacter chitinivorans]|uniref:Antimicrobial peptide system SdpA family protein n=1 Tax=Hymenobacter chitinivorans DSM 11115 TaxID=1121954 RepID=A0A2M9BSW9_9BACT|nr:SdpA family antimicrobial peptide system protein [Hymenobacter chitinivorans]PJJ61044.1 antimicrobial peptide system SdpA family protein [Hymenobacter chitinivorans DSM 11115]